MVDVTNELVFHFQIAINLNHLLRYYWIEFDQIPFTATSSMKMKLLSLFKSNSFESFYVVGITTSIYKCIYHEIRTKFAVVAQKSLNIIKLKGKKGAKDNFINL